MKHIRTLYIKLYSLELSFVLVIASPTTPTKAVDFLIYLLVKNNKTDRGQFGAKTFIKFEIFEQKRQYRRKLIFKDIFARNVSKIDFFQCIDFIPYPQARSILRARGGV